MKQITIVIRSELASLAHSLYTYIKHYIYDDAVDIYLSWINYLLIAKIYSAEKFTLWRGAAGSNPSVHVYVRTYIHIRICTAYV